MKFLDIIRDANANLFRNKLRSLLTIIAIFVGSFAIITNTAIQSGVNSFIDEQVEAYGGEGYIAIANKDTLDMMMSSFMGNGGEPKEYNPDKKQTTATEITAEQREKLDHIDGIDPESIVAKQNITIDYVTSEKTDKKFLISAQAIPSGNVHVKSVAGTFPDNDNQEQNQLMITPEMRESLGFDNDDEAVNKEVTLGMVDQYTGELSEIKATISGVSAPGVVNLGYNFVNEKLSNEVFDINSKNLPAEEKDKIYTYTASYDFEKYSSDDIYDKLREVDLGGITVEDIIGQIKAFFDIMTLVLNIFGAIALVAAAIGIINTLFMSVQERTREIGLDKALGMSSSRVFVGFSLEAILLGFWGSLVGVAISMLAGNAVNVALHAEGAILSAFPTFMLVRYTVPNILTIIAIIVAISFISGTAPAIKAAKKDPIDSLRYE